MLFVMGLLAAPLASDHWAFQPIRKPVLPRLADDATANPIDAFIGSKLAEVGLKPAPPADRITLLRRAYLDLLGLPPTPAQVEEFVAGRLSYPALVDQLLGSSHYGERWAQHWLDVVRYADTHGFEVNTPRANAWPYRDYVIRAFNEDKPYDRFAFEQIAGNTVGEDAATGFLVAAAVLLPGQIGRDEESKRLARQDSLDEIIVGTGDTFLGLTIGCARCHDHKFDPITQRDYYAMQAFFAGVSYGDRAVASPQTEMRKLEAKQLEPQIAAIDRQLRGFDTPAFAGRTLLIDDEDPTRTTHLKTKEGHGGNPKGTKRGYLDDRGDGTRVPNLSQGRYTWWRHKPGEDVFTYDPKTAGKFRIWLSWGAHGSGVHTRDARYVLDRDGDLESTTDQTEIAKIDQYHFAGVTKGSTEKKPLWSGFADAGVHELTAASRIILRGGETETGVTADVVLLQEELAPAVGRSQPWLRAPANPAENVERFATTTAKFVRFTVLATMKDNFREPCIDELEVFTTDEKAGNIALAKHSTKATASGSANSDRHKLSHINDGFYGNGRSWMSTEKGGGWVQLEFAKLQPIDRIVWARDREGKFKDRLPVRYRIEISTDRKTWQLVASSADRVPQGTPIEPATFNLRHLSGSDAKLAKQLAAERTKLTQRKQTLEKPNLVYAGKFNQPAETYVLRRGDPEQPQDRIGPQVPAVLGELGLKIDAAETDRRIALAKWITSPANPLTARVMVNRIWQFHFGTGLVATSSDFGRNGAKPSHPELLDWLAGEFVANGWSIKHLHRVIMTSGTYRQSSRINAEGREVDADSRLLWRFPSRRLEAEAIRDNILLVSGNLNLEPGGPGFSFFKSRGGLSGFPPVTDFTKKELRRMIYQHKIRMEPVPVFGAFDAPDAGQAMPRRKQSTTAIQALNLFNSPFVNDQAANFAKRVVNDVGDNLDQQVNRAFELALSRQPKAIEAKAAIASVRTHGLPMLCRVLFNSSEFLFLP